MSTPVPIELQFKSANPDLDQGLDGPVIRTFNSYSFNRNVMVPASAFRFTAPGIDKKTRNAIRSGDIVHLWCENQKGRKLEVAAGIIDETDTHILPAHLEYVLSGRDLVGQLVDNAAVDAKNLIVNVDKISLQTLIASLLKNTRVIQEFRTRDIPNGSVFFNTNPGETKITALDRYLEFTNCLLWALPNGQIMVGRPNFAGQILGSLICNSSDPTENNAIEARVKRNLNGTIRQIVTQLSTNGQVAAGKYTVNNAIFQNDDDLKARALSMVGRSVYRTFSYGSGTDTINQIQQVGNSNADPQNIGNALSLREIARENVKVLDIEIVVQTHVNENGDLYDVDQMYTVQIEDEDINEDMYVYDVTYDLTIEHGITTRLKLCKKGTIVAYSAAVRKGGA